MKQRGLLRHQPEVASQRLEGEFPDIGAVQQDPALAGIEHAQHQVDQGGLAGAARADQRNALARPDHEVHIPEDRSAFRVPKADTLEADLALGPRTDASVRAIDEPGWLLQLLEHALGSGGCLLKRHAEVRQRPGRTQCQQHRAHEARERSDRAAALQNAPARDHDDEGHDHPAPELEEWRQLRPAPLDGVLQRVQLLDQGLALLAPRSS